MYSSAVLDEKNQYPVFSQGMAVVTGGNGLLGRQVVRALRAIGWTVVAPTHQAVNLTDAATVHRLLADARPDLIVNCAAQRKPDLCELDEPSVRALNIGLPMMLAASGLPLIHVSSDYVFDGTNAPYEIDARRRPLNAYGCQKAEAEAAIESCANVLILRVPVLFGPTNDWRTSAVTVLAANLVAAKGASVRMDDVAVRYPTFTCDIARQMAVLAPRVGWDLHGIFHYSGDTPMTKYLMGLTMAPCIGCDPAQCVPDSCPPVVPRPYDCHLSVRRLIQANLFVSPTPFATALLQVL